MKSFFCISKISRFWSKVCRRLYDGGGGLVISIILIACTGPLDQANRFYDSADKYSTVSMKAAPYVLPVQRQYFLQIDDILDVKFFYSPELNENLVIRPDGKITLQLVGDIVAAGLKTEDLVNEIKKRFKGILVNPEISVIVRQHAPERIYVAGEIARPGELTLQGDLTALQAIIKSGDFTLDAERGNVVILRHNGKTSPEFILLDFVTVTDERKFEDVSKSCEVNGGRRDCVRYVAKSMPEEFGLQPFDVVFVPTTKIASAANFFTRYVNTIFPIYRNLGLSAFYQINPITRITP